MVLSDEEAILAILENPYMQYLVGLKYFSEECIFSPELFVYIRKRLGNDFFNKVTLQAQHRLVELSRKKKKSLLMTPPFLHQLQQTRMVGSMAAK